MTEIQWYYARDDQRFGPVSTVELKRLADRGQLAPGDLVWREGMADWTEAAHVKGLFHAAPPEPPPAAAASAAAVPPAAAPIVMPAVPQPTITPVATERPTARTRVPHPVESLLNLAHKNVSSAFVDATVRLFVLLGHWAMYVAMGFALVAGTAVTIREGSAAPILMAMAAVVVLLVLQYAAGQFCKALDRVNRSTRAAVVSTTLLDLLGLASMALGLGLLVTLSITAVASALPPLALTALPLMLAALLAFVLCVHLAVALFVHVDEHVVVSKELSPGEEALGTLCALLKAAARTVPVAFGAGVCIDTLTLLVVTVGYLAGSEAMDSDKLAGETVAIAFWAALPILGYVVFLLLALLFDILDGLLTLRHPHDQMPLDE
jgi:hypothetical protein